MGGFFSFTLAYSLIKRRHEQTTLSLPILPLIGANNETNGNRIQSELHEKDSTHS
jgi:hypothetical protein